MIGIEKTTKFGISEDDKINVDELDRTKGSANKKEEEENIEVIQNFVFFLFLLSILERI